MTCLKVDEIYLYVEKELEPFERRRIESHLASCSRCREAVASRARLAEAAGSLPDIEIPAEFSRQVMSRILASKYSLRGLFLTLAAGSSLLAAAFGVLSLATGKSLTGLLVNFNQYLWVNLRTLSIAVIKLFKLSYLSVKTLFDLIEEFMKGFSVLTGFISPQARIVIATLSLLLITTLFFMIRRRFLLGENNEK
jgi:hypothetical protein